MAKFSMRIVDADVYQAKPIKGIDTCFSEFRQSETHRIPIVRIFGSTASGQKACLHLHQTFPYIYVQIQERGESPRFAKQFASSLDLAIQISLGRSVSNVQNYVHDVSLVDGMTFYGFRDKQEQFLKVSLYNPNLIKKVEEILLSGSIMNRIFQPYESHIPYLLQFFMDYNLYGMNYIHLGNVRFRQPVIFSDSYAIGEKTNMSSPAHFKRKKTTLASPISSPSQTCYDTWHPDNLTKEMLVPDSVERQSTCLLEVDAVASDILNRKDIKESLGTCPGLTSIWEEEKQRRRLNNESTNIAAPVSQGERQTIIHDVEQNYLQDIEEVLEERKQRSTLMKSSESSESPDLESPNLISDYGGSPENELEDAEGYQPIVNEDSLRHSFCHSSVPDQSTPSASQLLDNQLIGILADMANSQEAILSQASSHTNGIEEGGEDMENISQAQEDDMNETIMMSQHVFDDIEDVELNNENGMDENDNNNNAGDNGDESLELDLDSWDASFLNAIPQIDGTFDIEDGSHKARKINTESGKCKAKVRTHFTNSDVTEVKQTVKSFTTCSCCSSKTSKTNKETVKAFEILQVDGSSDTDFWESCSNDRVKSRRTPLRTYDKASQIQIRGGRKVDRKKIEPRSSLGRNNKEKTVKSTKPFEAIDASLSGLDEYSESKIVCKFKHEEEIEDKSTVDVHERESAKCENEERQSIFLNQLSSNNSLGSQRDAAVSPKAFYSKSKHLALTTVNSSKTFKRKRLSLKPLEFVAKQGHKELSRSRKTKLSRSSSKSKKISFTEIVPDFSVSGGVIHKSGDKTVVQKGLFSQNSQPKLNDVPPIHITPNLDVICETLALSKSSQTTRKEEIVSSGSSIEFVAYGPRDKKRLLTRVRQIDAKCREDLTAKSQNESESEDDSSHRSHGSSGDISSSNDKVRECFVSLTDVCSEEIIPYSAESSLSAKSKSRRPVYSSSKKASMEKDDSSSIGVWGSSGGILIGSEDFCDSDVCNSCSDSLFKSSFPSPISLKSHSSPPRANSPTEALEYTRLLPSNMPPSSTLHSSALNDNGSRSANDNKEVFSGVENMGPHDVEIRFQNDHFCAQIKPVRLNFDAERVGDGGAKSGVEETEKVCHATRKRKRIPRKNDHADRGGIKSDDVYLRANSSSRENKINRNEADEVNDIQNASLASEDSLQNSDYCVKFTPVVGSSVSSDQQKRADTSCRSTKRLDLGRLLVAKRSTKSDHGKIFNVPSVGDVTQTELSLHDELEDSSQFSTRKSPSNSDAVLSEKIDELNELTDCCATAERKEQAETTVGWSFQASTVNSRSCNDERETPANQKKSDRKSGDSASFVVMESKEIILADDSIVVTPGKDSKNGADSKGVVEEGSLFTSSGRQHVENRIVVDLEADGSVAPAVSVAYEKNDYDTLGKGEHIMEIRDWGQGDSAGIPGTPEKEMPCIVERRTVVKKDDSTLMKPSQVLFVTSAQTSGIQHPPVCNFVTTNTMNQDVLPSVYLQNTPAMWIKSGASQLPLRPSAVLTPLRKPPSSAAILDTAKLHGLGETRHKKAYFSNPKDLLVRSSVVGGVRLCIKSVQVSKLPLFETESGFQGSLERFQTEQLMNTSLYQDLYNQAKVLDMNKADLKEFLTSDAMITLTPCKKPPKQSDIKSWLEQKSAKEEKDKNIDRKPSTSDLKSPNSSEVEEDSTPKNSSSFRSPGRVQDLANRLSKQRSIPNLNSPQFSPTVASLNSMFVTSPVSSTPLTTKRAVPVRPPQTLGMVPSHPPQKLRAAGKSKDNTIPMQLKRASSDTSDVEGPTPKNAFGFGFTQVNYDNARNEHEIQHLTLLSMELHVKTRRDLCPDPGFDPICAIFYHVTCETNDSKETGIFIVDPDSCVESSPRDLSEAVEERKNTSGVSHLPSCSNMAEPDTPRAGSRNFLNKSGVSDYVQRYYSDEKSMIMGFQSFIRSRDPDMIVGYEIQMLSWGYLIDRAKELDVILCPLLSRIPKANDVGKLSDDVEKEAFLYGHVNEFKITGRILLNVWRIMRSEVALRVYSFENVAFHVLHQRLPKYSYRTLSFWWSHQLSLHRWRVVDYYIKRCRGNLEMLIRTDFISRTSELARLFGILFYSVISRGTQFRVESMMLRIAKPMGYIPVSPSVRQRALMAAPEVIPLVMEPESRFYSDPVIVLDFQSLYPSIIIAYNYCYSTCLGRVKHWNELGEFKFGATSLSIPTSVFEALKDQIHVSPNGVGFVKQKVKRGILPRMLDDILKTRIMVKTSMKKNKENQALHRMLDARQLGLKLIANVTYGYTSANFSGRMPCVEIADSVVRKGREALETAIKVINSTEKWNARVVYGDTDSVFILMKGATKKRAFQVANEIVDTITKMNPQPMKLKFEKVYMPCILQTKKRYMGYMYETLDQKEPVFDAKGIETVRRDSCAAVSKILERSLKILFETKDLSLVKRYVERQFTKIMEDRVSVQDFTFAKEYRGMGSYKPGACVPALAIARRLLSYDKHAEPRPGERVPYVVVYGTPGLPLIQLVKRPCEVMQDSNLRLNGSYYITKQIIPSLNRAFSLIGVDVFDWYNELPRPQRKIKLQEPLSRKKKKGTISQYFSSTHCPICGELTRGNLCSDCKSDPQSAVTIISSRVMRIERKFAHLSELCCHCTGSRDQINKCISQDCPVFHKLYHVKSDLAIASSYRGILDEVT